MTDERLKKSSSKDRGSRAMTDRAISENREITEDDS